MWFVLKLIVLLATLVSGQTYTVCDPLKFNDCRPCKALGRAVSVNFTNGPSDLFFPVSSANEILYNDDGAHFIVSKQGNNPTIQSDFYIMFGRVEAVLMASEGQGIVSSFVLQSDDLDEIDIEWLGTDEQQFQTNYFSKGNTTTYDRGQFHNATSPPQKTFHNYTVDWTEKQIVWYYDGTPVRTLSSQSPHGYPQTPMAVRLGSWAGGDPRNAPGTIEWAGGLTNYSEGPFTFKVQSVYVRDYSTGVEYTYGDQSGTWTSIQAVDGEILEPFGADMEEDEVPALVGRYYEQHGSNSTNSIAPFAELEIEAQNVGHHSAPRTILAMAALFVAVMM